ncbi:MAG TPA: AraC family transcriptional regulator, partial [Clostridia bacterium]|nr:AraC family transcriptional regulator [Clostridia bacterium]
AFTALLATRIITRPMNKIVLDVGGQKHDLANPFRFLQEYLNKLSLRSDQLSAEKVSLLRSKERFLALMHDEIYFGMLTNPNFHLDDEYVCSVIPEIRDQKPCLLVLITPKYQYHNPTRQPQRSIFEPFADRIASIEINEEQYFFLWTGAQEIDARERAVAEVLERLHMDHAALARADHPGGIHAAYRQLKLALDKQRSDWLVLPVSVENRIVNLLRTNAAEKCRQLLLSLRGQHTPDALMRLMGRVATEYGYSLEALLDQYYRAVEAHDKQAQWDTLEACVAELCAFAAGSRRKAASGPSAADVCHYVREHYNDPDLCAALLADRFTMHRTLISKLIKTHTGLTFSDWLQQLRMEAAMRHLRETDLPAAAIAEQVGYTNYNTFKRAFIRHYGQTPREHREGAAKA